MAAMQVGPGAQYGILMGWFAFLSPQERRLQGCQYPACPVQECPHALLSITFIKEHVRSTFQ
jgi:hypothetical protein